MQLLHFPSLKSANFTATLFAIFYVACIGPEGLFSPEGTFTLVMAALVYWKHRDNVRRLIRGEEHQFSKAMFWRRWLKH